VCVCVCVCGMKEGEIALIQACTMAILDCSTTGTDGELLREAATAAAATSATSTAMAPRPWGVHREEMELRPSTSASAR
jgi:hypothetical protein